MRLFDELVGCHIISKPGHTSTKPQRTGDDAIVFTDFDAADIKSQIGELLGDTFQAALGMSVHFQVRIDILLSGNSCDLRYYLQPLPNAFELYGVDFLVSHMPDVDSSPSERKFQVTILEVNSEPAIEMTGPRLTWILEDLFVSIGKVCVAPFFYDVQEMNVEKWEVGQTREHLRKCLEMQVRGADGWNRV